MAHTRQPACSLRSVVKKKKNITWERVMCDTCSTQGMSRFFSGRFFGQRLSLYIFWVRKIVRSLFQLVDWQCTGNDGRCASYKGKISYHSTFFERLLRGIKTMERFPWKMLAVVKPQLFKLLYGTWYWWWAHMTAKSLN